MKIKLTFLFAIMVLFCAFSTTHAQNDIIGYSPPFPFITTPANEIIGYSGFFAFNTMQEPAEEIVAFSSLFALNTKAAESIIEYSGFFAFNTVLEPEVFTVVFQIIDSEGNPLEDAQVTLGDMENVPGDYDFEQLPEGTYTYSVSRLCYHEEVGEVFVDSDQVMEIVMTLDLLTGDANGDGDVNVLDIITIGHYYTGETPAGFCFHNADVNSDGIVDILDIIGIVNLFSDNKLAPYPGLNSEDAHIYLGTDGIQLHSDGTLAGLQFELTGDISGLELHLALPDHEIMYLEEDGIMRAIIFSIDNTPIPSGMIDLAAFSRSTSAKWLNVLAGNLNAEKVPVIMHADLITSLENPFATDLNAYPNPASHELWVEFSVPFDGAILKLINIHGQMVRIHPDIKAGSQQLRFNVDGLPSGIYILRLSFADENTISKRVMLK